MNGIRLIKIHHPDLFVSCNLLTVADNVINPAGIAKTVLKVSRVLSEIYGLDKMIKKRTKNNKTK